MTIQINHAPSLVELLQQASDLHERLFGPFNRAMASLPGRAAAR